ncbi:MAG: LysE type translocator [Candidatus Lokiarchaeum sp. GC14_75]|nr:MAG: LysE type translocator [Candidatus Lokiarchaeum sp. GC14_75]
MFFFSFLIALTGALSPGPLLTFTIYKSLNQKRGYLAGFYIILGHSTIEFVFIIGLLAGATILFQNIIFLTLIGIFGGIFLILFGFFIIRDVKKRELSLNLFEIQEDVKGFKGNSYLGGIIVSLSNPYWEFWWAVIGLSFIVNFQIGFHNPLGLLLFFIGHELGDFVWYVPISLLTYFGSKTLNPSIYKYILIICGAFMIAFGVYLIFNVILFPPSV